MEFRWDAFCFHFSFRPRGFSRRFRKREISRRPGPGCSCEHMRTNVNHLNRHLIRAAYFKKTHRTMTMPRINETLPGDGLWVGWASRLTCKNHDLSAFEHRTSNVEHRIRKHRAMRIPNFDVRCSMFDVSPQTPCCAITLERDLSGLTLCGSLHASIAAKRADACRETRNAAGGHPP